MKTSFLILFLFPLALKAQDIKRIEGWSFIQYGYHKSGIFDTVATVMLISKCDTCHSQAAKGYIVRERYDYFGDNMPSGNYYPQWMAVELLDKNKQPLRNAIVWYSKISEYIKIQPALTHTEL